MKSTDLVKDRASKLSNVLGGLGFDLNYSDSLKVISKLDSNSNHGADTGRISEDQKIAEEFLEEMLDAKSELNYAKFTQRMNPEILEEFTEKRFLRAMRNLREDYGPYVNRHYLGAINGGHYSEPVSKYPGKVRHIWRGVFENQEVFITVSIFIRDGVPRVGGILFR